MAPWMEVSLRSWPPLFPLFPLFRRAAYRRTGPRVCSCSVRVQPAAAASTTCLSVSGGDRAVPPCIPPGSSAPASWDGLHEWRAADVDARTAWGAKGPEPPSAHVGSEAAAAAAASVAAQPLPPSLAECGRAVLLTADPLHKAALTFAAWQAYKAGQLPIGTAPPLDGPPARPAQPQLVPPRHIPSMDRSPLPKNCYMLHNLTHVELNAVDLAWDTVVRFSGCGLPEPFYADFARVAADESRHLSWCLQRLSELGCAYGDMPAHALLWQGCQLSRHDVGARLAVVPLGQEARGLDAGPRLAARLVGMGDNRSAAVVRRIAAEERAHVAVGVYWFTAICSALGTQPAPAFRQLLLDLCPGLLKGPFNDGERLQVGLPPSWYTPALWEPAMRAAAEEAVAAAERGARPAAAPTSAALAPVGDLGKLQQLAGRLGAMLDLELAGSRSS